MIDHRAWLHLWATGTIARCESKAQKNTILNWFLQVIYETKSQGAGRIGQENLDNQKKVLASFWSQIHVP